MQTTDIEGLAVRDSRIEYIKRRRRNIQCIIIQSMKRRSERVWGSVLVVYGKGSQAQQQQRLNPGLKADRPTGNDGGCKREVFTCMRVRYTGLFMRIHVAVSKHGGMVIEPSYVMKLLVSG